MEWIYTIDGTEVEAPTNWHEFSAIIERDLNRKAIFYKAGSGLTFAKKADTLPSGYDVLDAADTDVCERVTITVEYRASPTVLPVQAFSGFIYMTELVWGDGELDEDSVVTAVVQDNSWQAMVRNNVSIKATPAAWKTKLGNPTAVTPTTYLIDFFTPSTGAYDFPDVACWSTYEVFGFLVSFMTDNQLTFASNLFAPPGGIWNNLYITMGQNIRAVNGFASPPSPTRPIISFEDTFTEVDKMINLGMTISDSGVLSIERYSDIFDSTTVLSLSDIKKFVRKADTSRLYAKVVMGSEPQRWHADGGVSFPDVRYFTHKAFFKDGTPEEYHTTGICNFDTALDLKGVWARDTDVIEDILINNNDQYDGDVFFIQVDPVALLAFPGLLTSGESYYNPHLLNSLIAPRMTGLLGSSIAFYDSGPDNSFRARKSFTDSVVAFPTSFVPMEFATEISDPSNNYDNATFRYSNPTSDYYRFGVQLWITNAVSIPPFGSAATLEIHIQRRNGVSLIEEHIGTFVIGLADERLTYEPAGFYMEAADFVRVTVEAISGQITFDITGGVEPDTSYFYTLQAFGEDGVFESFDAERSHLIETECPVSLSDFETIRANPTQRLSLNSHVGNIERMEYFYADQRAEIQITG